MFRRLLISEKNFSAFNYYPGGMYRQLAGTTTLAYRIKIKCTTVESVLEIGLNVSTSLLWSSSGDLRDKREMG